MNHEIVVIGGGAAGLMAAIIAAQNGASVTLLERNPKVGRKIYITGKGRCNLTNDCAVTEVLANIPCGARFLTSAITRFSPKDVQAFFEELGVPLKIERGNRVFPASDKASDIIDALFMTLRHLRIAIVPDRATHITTENGAVTGVVTEHSSYRARCVIVATGGISYPMTGSTGDGYEMATDLGHTVKPLQPSLVALEVDGSECKAMQGLSLRNVAIQVKNGKNKTIFAEQGEMLYTHFGLSGPLILSASAHLRDWGSEHYAVIIDLKPALDEQTLDARLLREMAANANRAFHNVLETLAPRLLVPTLIARCGIPAELPVNTVTKVQRKKLGETLKALRFEVARPRPIEEAIVTSGGVATAEVDPKTMQSKRVKGLYFAGEVLDVDAYTGGFNLQIAWSTGHAAGAGAAAAAQEDDEFSED